MVKKRFNIFFNKYFLKKKYSFIDEDIKKIYDGHLSKEEIFRKYGLSSNQKKYDLANLKNIQSIFLYKSLFSEGAIINACKFRYDFINFLTKKKFKNYEQFITVIKALIDNGQFQEAHKLSSNFQISLIFSIKYYLSYFYLKNISSFISKILNKKHKFFFNLNVMVNNNAEKSFEGIINEKRIALVGPGYNENENGNEIDNFDLVIRMNLFKDYTEKEKIFFGSKTDIIYFNGEMFNKISKNEIPQFLINKYLCSRLNFSDKYYSTQNKSTRKLNINLMGSNGFLQDIVIDLLHYQFKELKIFNFDFFLKKKKYFDNYSKPNDMKNKDMFNTQSKLDFFSGINLIRNLEKMSIINVDKDLKDIISSSNSQLALQFNHLYKESK